MTRTHSLPRLELEAHEGRWLRRLLLGDEHEVRLLARISGGKVAAAARSDLGPVPTLAGASPERMHALARRWGIRQVVCIDASSEPEVEVPDLLDRVLDPAVRAEPPWSAGLDRLISLAGQRWLGGRLLADGAYGLISPPTDEIALQGVCLRLRRGRVDRILGPSALGLEPGSGIVELRSAIRRRVGTPQLIVSGQESALRRWLESEHPATALERAVLRGWLRVEAQSWRISLARIPIRLWELQRERTPTQASKVRRG